MDVSGTLSLKRPRLSVIVVSMGRDELLDACIASITEHVHIPHEIIVVNNSPLKLGLLDAPGLNCLEAGRNLGFARAVNWGIRESRGDLILLFNPDARFTGDAVSGMVEFLETHPRAGIVGPQLVFPDGTLQNSVDLIPNLATELLNKSLLKILLPRAYPSKRSGFRDPVEVPSVIGACMMIRRPVIDKVGLLDEGFFLYLEETDFCRRASLAGFEVWHLPGITVDHHQGVSAKKFDAQRKVEYLRSVHRFFLKHKGPFQAGLLALLTLVKLGVEVLGDLVMSFSARGRRRLGRTLRVLVWLLAGMPGGWGLERTRPCFERVRRNGYTWFLPLGGGIPPEAADPGRFLEEMELVLNDSRTTLVKSGALDGGEIVLKRYNFKGLKDTVKNLFRKSRARRAFEGTLVLERCGVPTPPVVFACEKRILGVLVESYVATRRVEAGDLVKHVQSSGYDSGLIPRVAGFIRRLHEMGLIPVDLKGENLLVKGDALYLIDLDRLKRRRWPGMQAIAKNLSYLDASFARDMPERERLLFLDEYVKGNPVLEGRKNLLARRIDRLTRHRLKTRYSWEADPIP